MKTHPTKQILPAGIKIGLAFVLITSVLFASSPISVLAQSADTSQAAAYRNGINNSSNTGGSLTGVATKALACSAGQLLANVLTSAISSAISSVTDQGAEQAAKITNVSVTDQFTHENQHFQNAAEVGHKTPYAGILDATSWNSMAWCIVNSMIEYIADSTIRWANSGFNGNPAFIDNMDNFFTDLADREAGAFIQQFARNVSAGGLNICSPFKVQIAIGLSNYYGSNNAGGFRRASSCTLSQVVRNMEGFMNGNFSEGGWPGWFSMTQHPQNNQIGMTLLATDELYARISSQNNTAKFELGLNKGFLNFKKCETPGVDASCKTVTPGIVIQGELEKTLGLPKDRLILAQKFDQVVEALVNGLIKVALNEVLSSNK